MWVMTSRSRERGLIEFWIGRLKIAECSWNYDRSVGKGKWLLEACLDEHDGFSPAILGEFNSAGEAMKYMHELLNSPCVHAKG